MKWIKSEIKGLVLCFRKINKTTFNTSTTLTTQTLYSWKIRKYIADKKADLLCVAEALAHYSRRRPSTTRKKVLKDTKFSTRKIIRVSSGLRLIAVFPVGVHWTDFLNIYIYVNKIHTNNFPKWMFNC